MNPRCLLIVGIGLVLDGALLVMADEPQLRLKNAGDTPITIWVRPENKVDWLRPPLALAAGARGTVTLVDPGQYFMVAVEKAKSNRQGQSGWKDLRWLVKNHPNAELLVQGYTALEMHSRNVTVTVPRMETRVRTLPDGRTLQERISKPAQENKTVTESVSVPKLRFLVQDGDTVKEIGEFIPPREPE